jgi:hypothetical protein
MGITLANARIELSKQIGDYWASVLTSTGTTTTLVDTALMAKANDWISDSPQEMYDLITSDTSTGTILNNERKISSLDNTSGTLTTLAHSNTPLLGIGYEIHRLFTASEKRMALIYATRHCYPSLFKRVRDEAKVSGNWLKDGSFEVWTSTSALTNWTTSVSTLTQTSTNGLFKHGNYSAKLTVAAGNISQSITNVDDLKKLAGRTVTFTAQGHCATASCLRIGISDGTTTTYSDYHDGDGAWTANNEPLTVSATIKDHPTSITFYVYHVVAAGTSYIDDARVIAGTNDKIYIGDLGLVNHTPHAVYIEPSYYSTQEPWLKTHNWRVDNAGYLYLPEINNYRLRIQGIAYVDFLASGVSSTAWTASIDLDAPQLDILVADAIIYLYTQMITPNYTSGDRDKFVQMLSYWEKELSNRKARFGMSLPSNTVVW